MIQPEARPRSGQRDAALVEVCRPLPIALTTPTRRSASGTSRLTSVDLPTPGVPDHDRDPTGRARPATAAGPRPAGPARAAGRARRSSRGPPRGPARSALVRQQQRVDLGVVGGDQAAVDESGARRRVGQRADDDELVGVGHHDPFDGSGGVLVVGGTHQHRRALVDAHDPGQRVRPSRTRRRRVPPGRRPPRHAGPVPGRASPVTGRPRGPPCTGRGRRRPRSPRRRPRAGAGCGCAGATNGRDGPGRRPRRTRGAAAGQVGALARHVRPQLAGTRASSWRVQATSDSRDARYRQPDDRGGVRHPVVGVGLERRRRAAPPARSPARPSSSVDRGCRARASSRASAAMRSVSCAADVPDPVQPGRRVGERGERHQHRGQLADVGQVGVEAVHLAGAAHGQPGRGQHALAAHRGQQLPQPVAGLRGAARPAGHGHLAAGHQRGGQERRRAGQVRLDLPGAAGQPARLDHPDIGRAGRPRRPRPPAASAPSSAGAARTVPAARRAVRTMPLVEPRRRPAAARTRVGWRRRRRWSPRRRRPARCRARSAAARRSRRESIRTPDRAQRRRSADRAGGSGRTGRRRRRPARRPAPATGGMNRMTVPASPTSTLAGPASGRGRTTQRSSSAVDTWPPIARRPAAISSVSRARSGYRMVDGPSEIADSTSARAVIDFDPGRRTVACTGTVAVGAVQDWELLATGTVCRPGRPRRGSGR